MSRTFDLNRNHFALFGLEPRFGLDPASLDRAYREIQSEIHPDKFAHLSDAERRASMQWATHVNGAYQTLKSPQARARYMVELGGGNVDTEGRAGLPGDFLLAQLEWREKVESALARRDGTELAALERDCQAELQLCVAELERALDRDRDLPASKLALFRLMFLDRLRTEIGDALETVETAT